MRLKGQMQQRQERIFRGIMNLEQVTRKCNCCIANNMQIVETEWQSEMNIIKRR